MSVIGVVFLSVAAQYFVVIFRNNAITEMAVTSQNLLRTTVENIRFGDGVRQTNQISDPNGPVAGWNTDNANFVIIIAIPALDNNRDYILDPNTGSPYMNELVYYKDEDILKQRILAHPSASGNRLRTTCPASAVTSTCSEDPVLAHYVNDMSFTLYDQNSASTQVAEDARSVQIDLSMQRNAPGDPITYTNDIRVTLRNRF
jgi:hypothetical protein